MSNIKNSNIKKTLFALLIVSSLMAFISKVNSKAVTDIEVSVKTLNGQTVNTGKTDKKGKFNIAIKDKGNFGLVIPSAEILKGLNTNGNAKKTGYVVTLIVEAETTSWDVDAEHNVTHKQTIQKNSTYEIEQGIIVENGEIKGWEESMINIISKGDGKIKGSISYRRSK